MLFRGTVDPAYADWVAVTLGNVDGLILYRAFKMPMPALACVAAYVLATRIEAIAAELVQELRFNPDPAIELLYEYRLEAILAAIGQTGAAAWWSGAYVGIETLRLRVMTMISGFNTFGTLGLAAGVA